MEDAITYLPAPRLYGKTADEMDKLCADYQRDPQKHGVTVPRAEFKDLSYDPATEGGSGF